MNARYLCILIFNFLWHIASWIVYELKLQHNSSFFCNFEITLKPQREILWNVSAKKENAEPLKTIVCQTKPLSKLLLGVLIYLWNMTCVSSWNNTLLFTCNFKDLFTSLNICIYLYMYVCAYVSVPMWLCVYVCIQQGLYVSTAITADVAVCLCPR